MTALYNFTAFAAKSELQEAAAEWIASALRNALNRRGSAVFMASGGRTPGPIYDVLSQHELDWGSVFVGLTDERWVDVDHPASNGAMVENTLLKGPAAAAEYVPMKLNGDDPFASIADLNELYMEAGLTDVMLLGMGPDAHTLSWFKGGRGYESAIDPDTTSIVAAVEAIESEVTGTNLLRMTLTQPCVAYARKVLLLITGEDKKQVFETADPDSPVGIMKAAAGDALTVFYAP